jgi:cobalt-zinc-cadmium efflux system outer membrane protein
MRGVVQATGLGGWLALTALAGWATPPGCRAVSVGAEQPDGVVSLPPLSLSSSGRGEGVGEPAAGELAVDALLAQVLANNPSLAQMQAALQAARARYPQVISLEDPSFAATVGVGTFRPDDPGVEFAYRLELSQKIPWPGKRRLRGEQAQIEAQAAASDLEEMRLNLLEAARQAVADYYLAARGREVNLRDRQFLDQLRSSVAALVRIGQRPEQDLLQVVLELGQVQTRQLTWERQYQVAQARINTLRRAPPEEPLPAPPQQLPAAGPLPALEALQEQALARRPEVQALARRVQAEEIALALAEKEYYPDLEPFVMYDRFMGNTTDTRDLATMVGVRLNLPVWQARRAGAVAEARARLAQRRAEWERRALEVRFEVAQARALVQESQAALQLLEQQLLPAAEGNLAAARNAYQTARVPLTALLEARRSWLEIRLRYFDMQAEQFRRLATLERALGGPLEETLPHPEQR